MNENKELLYLQEISSLEEEIKRLQKKYKDMERLFMVLVHQHNGHKAVIDQIDVITIADKHELIWLFDPQKKHYHFMVVNKG
jgi:hypothetical protein